MTKARYNIVILGLSVTSSWGNGHASTYRALMRELCARGHQVLFLERDVPWYAAQRDLPRPPYGRTELYGSLDELQTRFGQAVRAADLVMVGSFVPEGVAVGRWVTRAAQGITAFYDIDTPVTLAKLAAGDEEYLARDLVPRYGLYLSFSGGPILEQIERELGSPMARPLYCAVDPAAYQPVETPMSWDMGYLGTYSADRQPGLDRLMLEPARRWAAGRWVVAGPQYPADLAWPAGVARREHVPPDQHRTFYSAQRFTLNITRAAMARAGYSPSVRLFEAAACGTPIISDEWAGLNLFFEPDTEILISRTPEDTLRYVRELPEAERQAIGRRARRRVLGAHTAEHRVAELEGYLAELQGGRAPAVEAIESVVSS